MDFKWSEKEKEVSRQAFEIAYDKKCNNIIEVIKAHQLSRSDDIWKLGKFIKEQEKEVDRLFEYTYSKLIFAFAMFLKEDLINLTDLDGLKEDKIKKIKKIAAA
jgi:hypothetical protein